MGLAGQQPTGAAPSFAPSHAADCRSPAAGTSEESPVQTHIHTDMLRLYMDAQVRNEKTLLCMHIAHDGLRDTINAEKHQSMPNDFKAACCWMQLQFA